MKTIVCVSTDEVFLDLQKVRRFLISKGVVVLDFYEERVNEVHYVTRGMTRDIVAELRQQNYKVETFSDDS